MYDLPGYVWALVLIGVIGIPAATCAALYSGAVAAGLGRRTAARVVVAAGAVWGGWLLVGGLLASAGAFRRDPDAVRPWLALAFVGALTTALLATRIPIVSRILAAPGTAARLTLPHTLRIMGVLFIVVLMLGELPAAFAIPAGLGDIAVGLAAPVVAWRLSRGTHRMNAVWFNVIGIVDLVVAAGIGYLAGLGPTQVLHVTPSTEPLALLPLALVPISAVPLTLALHVVSLRALRSPIQRAGIQAATPAPTAG